MEPEDEPPEPEFERPPEPPEAPVPPPKPEIRIRDLGTRPRGCSVCGKAKVPYVEIEVDGLLEYTCQDCYEGQVIELAACRQCGAALEAGDAFCGKCGAPRQMKCATCGAAVSDEDRFCGKCGTKVT
ncbi:MAG: zinc ribbon domain-containing protein [Methanobacteriota archaeon]|nr:MAG: zinc ribbon domain-containing protein [Euryarchaeota archaeon]